LQTESAAFKRFDPPLPFRKHSRSAHLPTTRSLSPKALCHTGSSRVTPNPYDHVEEALKDVFMLAPGVGMMAGELTRRLVKVANEQAAYQERSLRAKGQGYGGALESTCVTLVRPVIVTVLACP
jgi:hypothetical protein